MAPEQAQSVLKPQLTAEQVVRSSVAHELGSLDMESLLHVQMINGASSVQSSSAGWSMDPNLCAKTLGECQQYLQCALSVRHVPGATLKALDRYTLTRRLLLDTTQSPPALDMT